jgi:hypothetical protein
MIGKNGFIDRIPSKYRLKSILVDQKTSFRSSHNKFHCQLMNHDIVGRFYRSNFDFASIFLSEIEDFFCGLVAEFFLNGYTLVFRRELIHDISSIVDVKHIFCNKGDLVCRKKTKRQDVIFSKLPVC